MNYQTKRHFINFYTLVKTRQGHFPLHTRASWNSLEIDTLDLRLLVRAVASQVGEVAQRVVALLLNLERLLTTLAELLDGAVEVEDDVILGGVQDLANGAGDARGVVMGILHCGELGRNLLREAVG